MATNRPMALVTGASSGIGKAAALALVEAGFDVVGTSRDTSRVTLLDGVTFADLDVASDESVIAVVQQVIERFGRIDVLVNNAGMGAIGAVEESSVAQAQALFNVNVFGVMRMTKAVLPHMRAQGHGRIINLSSVVGFLPSPYMAAYAASKHAIEGGRHSLGGRLRYLKAGSGAPLVLLHTVRTQAEHFRGLIPLVSGRYTVYALDLPGMGYSEIVPGASYQEPAMRAGVERLLTELDLHDVTLVGESMAAVLALTAAADLPERVRRVVAVNAYDYRGGIARSSLLARVVVGGVLTPVVGPMVAGVEPKPALRRILQGGLGDKSALRADYRRKSGVRGSAGSSRTGRRSSGLTGSPSGCCSGPACRRSTSGGPCSSRTP
jgi:NAD(P)-dependent dehydrogenase (short-subunit alcohol dehydrogenase family)